MDFLTEGMFKERHVCFLSVNGEVHCRKRRSNNVRRKTEEEERNGIIAIAVDRGKNCSLAVRWAVEHLLLKNGPPCFLVHVQCKTPISEEKDGRGARGGRSPTKEEVTQFFLPYQTFCAKKGVKTIELILEDSNVTSALTEFIIGNSIGTMILGAHRKNALTRKIRQIVDVPTSILRAAPESCVVYIVSKGKVQTGRKPSRPQTPSSIATSFRFTQTPTSSTTPSTPRIRHSLASMAANPWHSQSSMKRNASTASKQQQQKQPPQEFEPYLAPDSPISDSRISFSRTSWRSEVSDRMTCSERSSIDSMQMARTPTGMSQTRFRTTTLATLLDGSQTIDVPSRNSISNAGDFSGPPSLPSIDFSSENLDLSIAFGSSRSSNVSQVNPRDLEEEMRRLRVELKRSIEMYQSVRVEAAVAKKQMASELQQLKTFEARKVEEARVAEAWSFAETEKQKAAAALEAAKMAQKLAETEFQMRKNAELKAVHEMEERQRAQALSVSSNVNYRKYTIEQVEAATDCFENSNKIGEGGYGPVFKGILDHTPVAIKVLRPNMSCGQRQFRQEIEVLSTMRHPHMVILIGACPEYGTLVYEYMEKGSLEDCLFRKKNTPPIPWRIRFRIAAEIASGILFLHEAKPEPLVHRDLKPANILLDRNYVSKIADVGLARLVPPSVADNVTQYRLTAAAGTFCYIDPEYQQTGMLGVKSDLYSLGVMLLQLITARPPMGLSYQVEEAIRKGTFSEVLDPELTDWPVEEALSFANMALKCCELRKKDRPDLATVVLLELIRLRDFAFPNQADEPEIIEIPTPTCPDTSESVVQAEDPSLKMNPKRCWQKQLKVKSMTKVWSLKWSSSSEPRSSSRLPPGQKPSARKSNTSELFGCWSSFSSCNPGTNAPIQRLKSFS